MKIKILTIGKTKESWCQEGEKYYLSRVQLFADIEKIELPEEKITPSITEDEVKKREGERMLRQIPLDFYIVALSPSGKLLSSPKFAEFLQDVRDLKSGKICFLVGGPLGLSESILQRADKIISFSQMTFPHDLFRIFLLEQIYRGFSILAGKKYHKQ